MSQVSPSRLDLQIPRYPSSEILSKYFLNPVPRWKRPKLLKIQEQHWHSIIPKIASYYGRFWGLGQDYWLKFLPELMNVISGAKSQRQYGKYEKCSPKISYICLSASSNANLGKGSPPCQQSPFSKGLTSRFDQHLLMNNTTGAPNDI